VGPLIASRVLPMLLVLMLFFGAFYASIDLTAGEKERGTLETLLVAPVHTSEVMAAKYLTVSLIAAAVSLFNLISMLVTFGLGMRMGEGMEVKLSLSAGQLGMVILVLIPAACLCSGLSLVVASLARGYKDAQHLLTCSRR
jgi:sodium transport system permease protein